MLSAEVKAKIEKTKKFVNENRTLTACAITAAVTAKIVHNATIEHCAEKIWPVIDELQKRDEAAKNVMFFTFDFLDSKGLMQEYIASVERA